MRASNPPNSSGLGSICMGIGAAVGGAKANTDLPWYILLLAAGFLMLAMLMDAVRSMGGLWGLVISLAAGMCFGAAWRSLNLTFGWGWATAITLAWIVLLVPVLRAFRRWLGSA